MANRAKITFFLIAVIGVAVLCVHASWVVADEAGNFTTVIEPKKQEFFKKEDLIFVSAAEVEKKLKSDPKKRLGFYLVDLRNEADFAESFIPGAINIPSPKLTFLAEKMFAKSDEIVFYSHANADHISSNAVIFMKNKGYDHCRVLKGGIGAWLGNIEQNSIT